MKKQMFLKRVSAVIMASALMATTAIPAFAASSTNAGNNTATVNDLANADIIDMSKTGSLSIYKYDITSAQADNIYAQGDRDATGETDAVLEGTLADYAIKGVEYTYLRLGNIETYSVNNGTENFIEVVYEIPTGLAPILGLTKADSIDMSSAATKVANPCVRPGVYHYTSKQLNDALQKILENDNIAAKDALEEYVENSSGSVALPLTDENGYTHAEDLELGLYLLVETKVPEEVVDTTNPWFVSLPFTDSDGEEWLYDMTCYPKNQTGNPSLDKLVRNAHGKVGTSAGAYENYNYVVTNSEETDEAFVAARDEYTYDSTVTASEGDVLDYILVSKLPHITSEATYLTKYTFVDVLGEGITYNKDVRLAFYTNKEDAMVNNTANAASVWGLSDSDKYAQEYVDVLADYNNYTGETSMTVSFTEKGLEKLNTKYSDYYVVVYYTGTVNSDATAVLGDDGNVNDVTLTWERTSEGYYDALEDRCYVYTFGLNVTKYFTDKNGNPKDGDSTKVQFVLYNTSDDYYVVADKTAVVDGKKVYYITGKTVSEDNATVFSPDANGALIVNGLEGDTYQLTEIATDNGYSLLKNEIVISIKSTEREITPAVAGHVGLATVDADKANGHDEGGRTTGKTDMYVSDLVPCSATVDTLDAAMSSYVVSGSTVIDGKANSVSLAVKAALQETIDSQDALVNIGITNSQTFLLPQTGGYGLYAITILGVLAVAAGCYFFCRAAAGKKKEA